MKSLDVELLGQTRAAVLSALLLRPERALHVRELARLTGASPGSLHRELDQGVSVFFWLLVAQQVPPPRSDTRKPKRWLAMTLIHGMGVGRSAVAWMR